MSRLILAAALVAGFVLIARRLRPQNRFDYGSRPQYLN